MDLGSEGPDSPTAGIHQHRRRASLTHLLVNHPDAVEERRLLRPSEAPTPPMVPPRGSSTVATKGILKPGGAASPTTSASSSSTATPSGLDFPAPPDSGEETPVRRYFGGLRTNLFNRSATSSGISSGNANTTFGVSFADQEEMPLEPPPRQLIFSLFTINLRGGRS
jgi:hypothetical protein